MAAASSVEEKPCPEVMGVALDTVACAVPAQTKMEEPKHQAFGDSMRGAANALTLPACAPKPGDQVYTKILCCACGIGEVLGQVIIGEHNTCFCLEQACDCGTGGRDGCLQLDGKLGCFKPDNLCGCFCKTFCFKCGLMPPCDRPYTALPCQ
mmetsp:Transcript_37975/g.88727  ORF Transcript_37975/g.88727 Transcript_37975/m.88727 type:complete len:152 (+) Transcript_37975:90-545(+)